MSSHYTRRRNKQHHRFQLRNLSLLVVLLVWVVYLLDGQRKNNTAQQVMHQVVSTASTIVRDGVVLPTNDCLVQLRNVKGIKLYSQNDEDGALLQVLRCSKFCHMYTKTQTLQFSPSILDISTNVFNVHPRNSGWARNKGIL